MCELTNQSTLGFHEGGLKETGVFQGEGEYRAATVDSMRIYFYFLFFFSTKACKPNVVLTPK